MFNTSPSEFKTTDINLKEKLTTWIKNKPMYSFEEYFEACQEEKNTFNFVTQFGKDNLNIHMSKLCTVFIVIPYYVL